MAASYHYPYIAREGWSFIFLLLLVSAPIVYLLGWLYLIPSSLALAWLLFVFRDPPRKIPALPLAVVSPVDGEIISTKHIEDPYLHRPSIRLRTRMHFAGVYSLSSPMEGKVMERWYPEDKVHNSNASAIWVQSDEGDDVVFVLRGGWWHFRPDCGVQSGERIGQGQRCGFMRFGSIVDIYLPERSRPLVKCGDRVSQGSSVVANLVHD